MHCQYCFSEIEDEPFYCPLCKLPHHEECWKKNGSKCAGFNCKGTFKPELEKAEIKPESAENESEDDKLTETEDLADENEGEKQDFRLKKVTAESKKSHLLIIALLLIIIFGLILFLIFGKKAVKPGSITIQVEETAQNIEHTTMPQNLTDKALTVYYSVQVASETDQDTALQIRNNIPESQVVKKCNNSQNCYFVVAVGRFSDHKKAEVYLSYLKKTYTDDKKYGDIKGAFITHSSKFSPL